MNTKQLLDNIVTDVRNWFDTNAPKACAVIGISGGKDSTIAAGILVRALGADRVIGVMMPNGVQPDINDSERVISALKIKGYKININNCFTEITNTLVKNGIDVNNDVEVNLQPRLRMATLYAVAQSLPHGGIVINTCNKSEDYIGYATKYGDCAGDISILGNLLVSEIYAIGDVMSEIPNDLVHKTPSDGLWGVSDEDKIGFTYANLEDYILTGTSGIEPIDKKIEHMHKISRHKYNPMYVC